MSKLMPWGANYTVTAEIGPTTNFFTLLPEVTRTNLVPNPNFEVNITTWNATGGAQNRITTDSYSGVACLQQTKVAGRTEVILLETIPVPVVGGRTYTVSAYFKVPAGQESMNAGIRILWYDAAGAQIPPTFIDGTYATLTNTNGWQRRTFTGVAPANAVSIRSYFGQKDSGTAGQTFLLDAVMIEEASTALPYFDGTYANAYTGYGLASQKWNGTANASTSTSYWYSALTRRTNLLTNPNFETNTTGWGANASTIARSTANQYKGTASLLVTSTTTNYNGAILSSRISVVPNTDYILSAYCRNISGNTRFIYIGLQWFTSDGTYISEVNSFSQGSIAVADGWVRRSATGTAPANAGSVQVFMLSGSTGLLAGWETAFDAVMLEQASSALPYFDGTYVDDYSGYAMQYYRWDGTANASTSSGWWYVGNTRTNLVLNPSLEVDTTNWQAQLTTFTRVAGTFGSGSWVGQCVATSAGVAGATAESITVSAGTTLTASATVLRTVGTRSYQLYFNWFNGATYISTTTGTANACATPTRLSVTGTAPANTTRCRVYVASSTNATIGDTFQFDSVLCEQTASLLPYFDAVYADTYTGYTNYGATWNGTANASTSTRKWRLTSAITNPVLDGNWYIEGKVLPSDITDRVQDIVITRGRNDPFQDVTAGKANLLLINNDRALDPVNTSSPFYSPTTGTSGVTLKRKVVIYYESTAIFTGLITDIDITYAIGPNNITISDVTFEVSDVLSDLASRTIEEYYPTPELTGARIAKILALPEISYTGTTSLDTGTVQCLDDPIADQTNCLSALQTVARTEQGYLFAKGDNTLRFSNRVGPSFGTPSVFADDGTGVPYENLSIVFGEETLYNRIVVTAQDSEYSGVAQDLTSQSRYGIKTLSVSGLLFSDDDALKLAQYFLNLYSAPSYRFNDMQLKFAGQKVNLANQAIIMALDLGSKIRIKKTYISGTPSSVTQDAAIELIKHHITPTIHEVQFSLAPALTVFPLVLDDATYGILDSTNALVA